jgi:voltage-gated potassium channel
VNVGALILESYENISAEFYSYFRIFEVVSIIIFTIEYLVRLWVADVERAEGTGSLKARLVFAFSTFSVIDILAILPFYLPMLFPFDLRFIRILRLFRLLLILRLGRFSKSIKMIVGVLKDTRAELATTIFVCFILLVFSSTLMFYIEGEAQPGKFDNVGDSMWWAVATLTTVGYGDIYPITPLGKFLSAIIALVGIGFVALPTGIISSAFIERIQMRKNAKSSVLCTCPNCGNVFMTDVG